MWVSVCWAGTLLVLPPPPRVHPETAWHQQAALAPWAHVHPHTTLPPPAVDCIATRLWFDRKIDTRCAGQLLLAWLPTPPRPAL